MYTFYLSILCIFYLTFSNESLAITSAQEVLQQDLTSEEQSISEQMAISTSHLKAQRAFQIRLFQQLVDENDWVTAGEVFEKVKRVEDRRGE
jgi:hypothetical protein